MEMRAIPASFPSVSTPPRFENSCCFPISSKPKLKAFRNLSNFRIHCSNRQGFNSGESDNKAILDAFFLGKAMAEAITERIEASVGEFFSTVNQWQAEQQKQVQDLQKEVLEKAKKAKEKAAREALEVKGMLPKSKATTVDATTPEVAPPPPSPVNGDSVPDTKED